MLRWTDKNQIVKTLLLVVAVLIALSSLAFSHKLSRDLLQEEKSKMAVWAEAMKGLMAADENADLNLILKIINSNNTIPVIVLDSGGSILAYRNLPEEPTGIDSLKILDNHFEHMRHYGQCMRMSLKASNDEKATSDYINIYYEESLMLRRLIRYPYVQLSVVALFLLIALFALLASKRAEQNRIWVGLSRETAHQLGTPISSLMAWSEVLKSTYPDDPLLPEMDKDVHRLELIAERFSKIGSAPEFKEMDLRNVITRVVEYMDRRTSHKVHISVDVPEQELLAKINAPLFEWVIENLCKNAVDAMQGVGSIHIKALSTGKGIRIEVSDTGKGIARNRFKSVFKPGFTTKKRGWGLGLSLAKRIVEEYHHGRIYVKESELGKGTTFAIELA